MKVKLIPVVTYEVRNERGELIGTFQRGEKWEGMVSLVGEDHGKIITDMGEHYFENLFKDPSDPMTVNVVKASPSLISKIDCNPT